MRTHAAVMLCALASSAAVSAQDRGLPPAPPPPIMTVPPAPSTVTRLVELVPGEARCGSGAVAPVRIEPAFVTLGYGAGDTRAAGFAVTFEIDADGRPHAIKPDPRNDTGFPRYYGAGSDLEPSFAAWRFATGAPQRGCRIEFAPTATLTAQAPSALVQRYLVGPHSRSANEREIWQRVYPEASTCFEGGAPAVRMRAYPDFEAIAQPAGSWSFAMTAFDIDAKGKPVNVRVIGSGGNPALDRASIAAVKQSRFAAGDARKGCVYPYYRRGGPLAPPPLPDKEAFRPADARCPDDATGWKYMPPLNFPPGFLSRGIEGWAIIGYDVASWGQTGNVRVLAAEPAAALWDPLESTCRHASLSIL